MSESPQSNVSRPLSPHLQVYKPQITSMLSILHRLTGVALYIGLLLFVWIFVAENYCKSWDNLAIVQCFQSGTGYILGMAALAAWSFCLFYHTLNGIRHLFWDMGKGFELEAVNRSGVAVVIGSLLLTALSWYLAFNYDSVFAL